MGRSTYSFTDLSGAFAHPALGAYVFTGQGVGQVIVHMATEKTAHDMAADGAVMISKIVGDNGQITVECQQTSDVHKFLLGWYNYVKYAPTEEWAQAACTLRNTSDGTSHICTGISPQNVPDKTYAAQGGRVSWVLMCGDIQSLTA